MSSYRRKHNISHTELQKTPMNITISSNGILFENPTCNLNEPEIGPNQKEINGEVYSALKKYKTTLLPMESIDSSKAEQNKNKIKIHGSQEVDDIMKAYKVLNLEFKLKKPPTKPWEILLEAYKKDHHIFYTHIHCLSVMISFAILLWLYYIHFHHPVKIDDLAVTLSSISHNIYAKPWIDLQILNETDNCPSYYHKLMIGYWPGTINACKSNDQANLCANYEDYDPHPLYIWKDTIFCVKHPQFYSRRVKCKSDEIECYSGGCFGINEGCPITEISLNLANYSDTNGSEISTLVLSTERIKGKQPIINITFSIGDAPCLNMDLYPIRDYSIMKAQSNGCGEYSKNPTSMILDDQIEYEFYIDNDMEEMLNNLEEYKFLTMNRTVKLFLQKKFPLNNYPICADTDLLNASNSWTEEFTSYFSIVDVFIFIIGILQVWALILLTRNDRSFKRFNFIVLMMSIKFVVLFLAIFVIMHEIKIEEEEKLLMRFKNQPCFASQNFDKVFEDFVIVSKIVRIEFAIILCLFVTPFFFSLIFCIFKVHNKNKKHWVRYTCMT